MRGIKGTGKHGCCKVKGTDIGCGKCQGHFKSNTKVKVI